jgi:hypothetical protein
MARKKVFTAIFVSCLLILAYVANFGIRTTRLDGLRRLTEQNVRIGCPPEDVIRFLDAQHLGHSEFMKPEIMHLGPGHDYANQNVIAAIKRRTWIALLSREDIQLVFVFDENRKLTRIDLVPVYTSL